MNEIINEKNTVPIELQRNVFFVKEHIGAFKAANNYDILNPETKEIVLYCREEQLGFLTKIFRFSDYKRMTPFNLVVRNKNNKQIIRVSRGVALWKSIVEVFDEKDVLIGIFKQKFFSIGGQFTLFDADDNMLCTLKGKWSGWDFKFTDFEGKELAHITKKWAGLGKEMFTTADNYMININEQNVGANDDVRSLIIGSLMCIDMVLKE